MKQLGHSTNQVRSNPWGAQDGAFEIKTRQFFKGIYRPQQGVEFQRINDCRLLAQADVLGPKIAMALAHASLCDPLRQHDTDGADLCLDALDEWAQSIEKYIRPAQHLSIDLLLMSQPV